MMVRPRTLARSGNRLGTRSRLARSGRLPGTGDRRPWAVAALAALILAVALVGWQRHSQPTALAGWALAGPRGPACLRLIVANDVSGSMSDYSASREEALASLLQWAPENLRDTDSIGVLDFAGAATAVRGPQKVEDLASHGSSSLLRAGLPDVSDTALEPVLATVGALPPSSCDTVLALLSDGLASDLPATADEALTALQGSDVHDVVLLVPSHGIDVPRAWSRAFPTARPLAFDGTSANATALAIGRAIAEITGQELRRRE